MRDDVLPHQAPTYFEATAACSHRWSRTEMRHGQQGLAKATSLATGSCAGATGSCAGGTGSCAGKLASHKLRKSTGWLTLIGWLAVSASTPSAWSDENRVAAQQLAAVPGHSSMLVHSRRVSAFAQESSPADSEQKSTVDSSATQPKPRPDATQLPSWVVAGDHEQDGITYRLVLAGPTYRQRDCESELDSALQKTTAEFVHELLGAEAARTLQVTRAEIRERLIPPERRHQDVRDYDVGPMYTAYAQLAFDETFRQDIRQRWEQILQRQRMQRVGLWAGGMLAALFVCFAYLKLDHATRGFYTGRLQWLAGFILLGILTLEFIFL